MTDTWKTVTSPAEGLYKEKGSRFISFIYPVRDENEIKVVLVKIRKEHHSAQHHCYAWRLGTETIRVRSNDDGEPSSTAGKPILSQLITHELTNTLLVVVRYFGGTLLGASGLIHAYREAAADAVRNARIETRTDLTSYLLEFPYSSLNAVMQIMKNENIAHADPELSDKCLIRFSVPKSDAVRTESLFVKFSEVKTTRIE
jgi:uncharacterized YigZ family protein